MFVNRELQAFIDNYLFLKYHASKQRNCELKLVKETVLQASYGVGVRKGSPWKFRIIESILRCHESVQLIQLNAKWDEGPCSIAGNMTENHKNLPLEYFGGVYVLLTVAMLVSSLLLVAEHLYYRYRERLMYLASFVVDAWEDTTRTGREHRSEKNIPVCISIE